VQIIILSFIYGVFEFAATVLADAAVIPPSPKWPKMCRVGR